MSGLPLTRHPLRSAPLVALALWGCSGPTARPPDDAWAVVNGQAVTEREVDLMLRGGAHPGSAPASRDAVKEAAILQELAAQRAVAAHLGPDASGQREIDQLQLQLKVGTRRASSAAWYARELARLTQASDEDARRYYEANAARLGRRVHLLMILRRTPEEIAQAEAAVKGGLSFEAYARTLFPVEPGAKPPWDLGFMGWAQLPAPWRDVVDKMKVSDVSPVVTDGHGRYWILQLVEVQQGDPVSFDAALPMVRLAMSTERAAAAREQIDQSLLRGAQIERRATIAPKPPPPDETD